MVQGFVMPGVRHAILHATGRELGLICKVQRGLACLDNSADGFRRQSLKQPIVCLGPAAMNGAAPDPALNWQEVGGGNRRPMGPVPQQREGFSIERVEQMLRIVWPTIGLTMTMCHT